MSNVELEEDKFTLSQKVIQQIEPTPEKGVEGFLYKNFGISASLTKIVLVTIAILSFVASIIFFTLANYNFSVQDEEKLLQERISTTKAK